MKNLTLLLTFLCLFTPNPSQAMDDEKGPQSSSTAIRNKETNTGWVCTEIEDLGEDRMTCQWCRTQQIRFAHTMEHPKRKSLIVGCDCADTMSGETGTAKEREKYLTSRALRAKKWLTTGWKNLGQSLHKTIRKTDNIPGYAIEIRTIQNNKGGRVYLSYVCLLQRKDNMQRSQSKQAYKTREEAANAAFDYLWPAKRVLAAVGH